MPHNRTHHYDTTVTWTGNTGAGTASLRSYEKVYTIAADGKPVIAGSSDPAFRGDPARWNPEDLLVASLSACHMLWFLSLAAKAKLVVVTYIDRATGEMAETASGSGQFTQVTLHPEIVFAAGTTPALVVSREEAGEFQIVTLRDTVPVSGSARRFLRARVRPLTP